MIILILQMKKLKNRDLNLYLSDSTFLDNISSYLQKL